MDSLNDPDRKPCASSTREKGSSYMPIMYKCLHGTPLSRRRASVAVAMAAALSVVLYVSGCSSSSSSGSSISSTSSASAASTSKIVIDFSASSSDPYQAAWQSGAKKAAAEAGYTIKFIQQDYDQTLESQQAEQEISSGVKPAAWVWDPADATAGAATLVSLHATGIPVFQLNQYPPPNTLQYITAYAGVDDFLNGTVSGQMILKARAALIAKVGKLHSPGGNIALILFNPGFAAGIDRLAGFTKAVQGAGLKVIATAPSAQDAATGYSAMTSILPAVKAKGLDLVYAQNDDAAHGVIQALEAGGYKPGQNVMVVGGNCESDTAPLTNGTQFATGLQSAFLEGYFSYNRVFTYLKNPKVLPGMYYAPATADSIPTFPSEISQYNFIPNPGVLGSQVNTTELWGSSMKSLCNY